MMMQKRLRGLVLGVAIMFVAYAAYADNVSVSTYYPSPYGSYQQMDVTSNTHLATTSGGVMIGAAGNAGASLEIDKAGADSAILFKETGAGTTYSIGIDQSNAGAFTINNGAALTTSTGMVMTGAGNLGVGVTPNAAYKMDVNGVLHVGGTTPGNITITQGANTGNLQVSYSGGAWYAVYAP